MSGVDPTMAVSRSRLVSGRGQAWRRGGHVADFRRAAVALAEVPSGEASGSPYAEDAAEALLHLARRGDQDSLSLMLRPDPLRDRVTWSVACFGIGDLGPSDLHDFASASSSLERSLGEESLVVRSGSWKTSEVPARNIAVQRTPSLVDATSSPATWPGSPQPER